MSTAEATVGMLRQVDAQEAEAKSYIGSQIGEPFGKLPPRISRLAEALAKAQSEFQPVPKNKTAKIKTDTGSFEYKYADWAEVVNMVRPILARHGIAFTQPTVRIEGKLYLTTKLLHSSGETMQTDGFFIPENVKPQSTGSYLSYYKRYDGCSLLAIAPDEDLDGVLVEPEKAPPAPPRSVGRPKKEGSGESQSSGGTGGSRPSNSPQSKSVSFEFGANSEAAPAPPAFQTTDADVPDNIGTKSEAPSKEEKAEYAKHLRDYMVDMQRLGAFVRRRTGVNDTRDITKQQWLGLFKELDGNTRDELETIIGGSK